MFGTRQTLGKVTYLPDLWPDVADSGDTTASRLRGSVAKVITKIVQKLFKSRPTVFQKSSNSYLKVVQQLFKRRPTVFQKSSNSYLKVVQKLYNSRRKLFKSHPKVAQKLCKSRPHVVQQSCQSQHKVVEVI